MVRESSLRQRVAERAGHNCEYCHLPELQTSLPFQLDHVISEKHEGATSYENLAYACLHCNAFKGPNIAGRDHLLNETVRLFDPRRDVWCEHFVWEGPELRPLTAIGRVTVAVLRINLPYRVAVRDSLMEEGLFPPVK